MYIHTYIDEYMYIDNDIHKCKYVCIYIYIYIYTYTFMWILCQEPPEERNSVELLPQIAMLADCTIIIISHIDMQSIPHATTVSIILVPFLISPARTHIYIRMYTYIHIYI